MIDQVECKPSGVLAASGREAEWPHYRWVRVDSKAQPPYKFHPCLNPCAPSEWPYDLQALRGTEDWSDIIEWFLSRHPAVPREDVRHFEEELIRCSRGRQISVEIRRDPELATLDLLFTLWGFAEDEFCFESVEIKTMSRVWFAVPTLRSLMGTVGLDAKRGAFEDRRDMWKR